VLGDHPIETQVYDLWHHWKKRHGKSYSTKEEHDKRLNIFHQNFHKVVNHNLKSDKKFSMGFNKFMDMTHHEFKSTYLGTFKKTSPGPKIAYLDTSKLADSVDWRTHGAVSPIKDQGQCGSCWAFSTTGSVESLNYLKTGKMELYSEQQLVDCSKSYGDMGCNGGLMDYAFDYIHDHGITTENKYPYHASDQTCSTNKGAHTISGHVDVPAGDTAQLAAAVNQQPVSIAVDAEQWQFYNGGILDNCGDSLDHGVLLVGYTKDAWIVKNSWSESWGENGYIRLARPGNTCGLADSASYPTA